MLFRHASLHASHNSAGDVPMDEPPQRRIRLRRGGPRTPLPLLPLIAIAAGIGIAYVNQTAHATSASYRGAQLSAQRDQLRIQDAQLQDELARLESSERIVSAAQQFGMRPAAQWSYVASQGVAVIPSGPSAGQASIVSSPAVQRLLAALSGDFGPPTAR
jgi:hypothetical protein